MHGHRSRRGRARLGLVTAIFVLATGLSVMANPAPAAALTPGRLNTGSVGPGTSLVSTQYSRIERDGALSVPLPYNKALWIFADTFAYNGAGGIMDGSILGTGAIVDNNQNLAVTTESRDGAGKMHPLLPGAVENCPPGQYTFAWPESAASIPQPDVNVRLIVIYYLALCGPLGGVFPTARHTGVATFWYDATDPGRPIQATVQNQSIFPLSSSANFGLSSVLNPFDGLLYVYSANGSVGRVFPGSVGDGNAYRFWNGSGWVAGTGSAVPVAPGSYGPPSVQWIDQLGSYVRLTNYGNSTMILSTAPTPQGPWSSESTVNVADSCGCRTTSLHMDISDANVLRVSYVPNSNSVPRIAAIPLNVKPFGSYDAAIGGPHSIKVTGWTIDPDSSSPVTIAVYVDGVGAAQFPANLSRPDVGSAFPGYGSQHAFDATVAATPGAHNVCVYAINLGVGRENTGLGCRTAQAYVPVITAPSAPRNPSATAGDTQALVSWTAPENGGGAPASAISYTVTTSPAVAGSPFSVPAGTTSTVVNGLTNGTPYTFTIKAFTTGGGGPSSAATPAVTPAAAAGVRFHPIAPSRVLDSRIGPGWVGRLAAGTPRALPVRGVAGVPANATSVVLNVTVTGSTLNSFVTVYPSGAPVPNASNLNFANGQTIANLTTARIGADGAINFATAVGTTDIIADVVGYYDNGTGPGDLYNPMPPTRFLDSRSGPGFTGVLSKGAPRDLPITGTSGIPATATAVVLNVTATAATADSFLALYPKGGKATAGSNLNFATGQTIANLATVKLGTGGMITFENAVGSTHVIADVVGYYDPNGGNRYHPLIAPTRILDDRTGTGGYTTPLAAGPARPVTVGGANGIPPSATAVIANTTAVGSSANSFLTAFPTGQPKPNASNINFGIGQVVPNLVISPLGTNKKIDLTTAAGTVTVVMDASGYFATT